MTRRTYRLITCLRTLFAALALLSCAQLARQTRIAAQPPAARVAVVNDTLFGTVISDPYRWLEDGSSAEVRAWTEAQNAYTRRRLDAVPSRDRISSRLDALMQIGWLDAPAVRGDLTFYEKREGTENQAILYRRAGDGPAVPVLDPNTLSADGTIAMDWFYPSRDGALLAYGLSESGSERSTLYVKDLAAGEMLPDSIPHTRACSLTWLHDGTGFYYTRYPAPGSVPEGDETYYRRIYFHALGRDPAEDPVVFGEGRPKEDWPDALVSPDDRWLVAFDYVSFTHTQVYAQDRSTGLWRTIADTIEANFIGQVLGDTLYVMTNYDAPRYRLLATTLTDTGAVVWRTIIPERASIMQDFAVVGGHIVVDAMVNATSRLEVFSLQGQQRGEIPTPTLGTVDALSAEVFGRDLYFSFSSYFVPPRVFRYRVDTGEVALFDSVAADLNTSAFTTEQVWYPSKDSTMVSMFLVHRKGLVGDGRTPTLLTGYGGFGSSETPVFQRNTFLWLERGGLYAEPNLRGGGEYGEEWHKDGMLGKKQHTFDDFIAAAEWLIANGYTSAEKLAIRGGSNGGLLVGAAITQRPDLFRAAVCQVPLLDMLRYHRFLIGRLWMPEYGNPEKADECAWLYAYSPYHRVQQGVAYPAVLLTTAESDTRVDPMHARKMAARLQAANSSGRPILLWMEPKAGHGVGKPRAKIVDELTDEWSFIFDELGISAP